MYIPIIFEVYKKNCHRAKWTINKYISGKYEKYLSVIDFGILFIVVFFAVAWDWPTTVYTKLRKRLFIT